MKSTRVSVTQAQTTALHEIKNFNPEMFRLAREYFGYSRKEVAELIDVSPSFVTQVEDGTKTPSDTTLDRIVENLSFPKSFFFQTGRFEAAPTSLWRKRVTIPKGTVSICSAKIAVFKRTLARLLEEVHAPEPRLPRIDPSEMPGGPEAVADLARRHLRIPPGPIRGLISAIEEAGVFVIPFDFGTLKIDGCSDWVGEYPVIFYNPATARSRIRHTLSHELGHLIMHSVITEDAEDEADAFAAEFNMPGDEIATQLFPVTLRHLAELKLHWKSAMAAILHRAVDLSAISERKARYLWMQMRRLRYHVQEPHEEYIPYEWPTSINSLVQAYTSDMGFTQENLLSYLKLSERIFNETVPTSKMLRAI